MSFWGATTPAALLLAQSLSLPMMRHLSAGCGRSRRCAIIGANEVGIELARRIGQIHGAGKVVAFLDFDLVHARCIEINGMPAFSICEFPLQGMGGIWKRTLGIAIAGAALALIWPVMLAITILIKQSSPGPVLCKQRRYGLNGE